MPESFSGKSFYNQELIISTNSIKEYIAPIKIKLEFQNLNTELIKKNKTIINKPKI